jgi:hypothetical protein
MKVSFICPIRNKASHVERCVRSILAQTYSPMEIVLSDQQSDDGSLEIVRRLIDEYDGPNTIKLLSCDAAGYKGMIGLNQHLNFIDTQITGDIVIMCSADDWNHPDRALHTVRAFEEHNPSYVNTGVLYTDVAGCELATTDFPGRRDRWLEPAETISRQIGSNGSSAWARDLWQKYGPLEGCEQQDMILPMMALFERGIWYVDRVLHTYVSHASLDNAGVVGQIAAATDDVHRTQLLEINNFIHAHNWSRTVGRWQDSGAMERIMADPETFGVVGEKLTYAVWAWSFVRNGMIEKRVVPLAMNV